MKLLMLEKRWDVAANFQDCSPLASPADEIALRASELFDQCAVESFTGLGAVS